MIPAPFIPKVKGKADDSNFPIQDEEMDRNMRLT
jgi:hypothetical protein